jgi:lysophospholipase L1-like esterase
MKIVCIGDSLTFSFGVSQKFRWTNLLQNKLKFKVINKGINGDTTAGILSRSYRDVIKIHPSHVIIMGGTNDFIMGRSAESVAENIILLTQEARNNNITPIIGIQMFIAVDMAKKLWSPYVDFKKVNEKITLYRQIIIQYCTNKNIQYLDFYEEFSKKIHNENINYYIDGIHPSIKGHEIMTEFITSKEIQK